MVVAYRTPLIIVEDLHTPLILVGSSHQSHWVLALRNGCTDDTSIIMMSTGGIVSPARVGTVEDALLCTSADDVFEPNLQNEYYIAILESCQ